MKGYLVRIAPLILEGQAAFLRYSAMCAGRCAGSGLRPGLSSPRGCSGPAPGLNRAFQATKKAPRLCAGVPGLLY